MGGSAEDRVEERRWFSGPSTQPVRRGWLWTGLALCVAASVVPSTLIASPGRVALLKVGVATTLTLLPGWLYVVYLDRRGDSLYDEYVLNLFRLRIDDYANLPMPPEHTTYFIHWKAAHDALEAAHRSVTSGSWRSNDLPSDNLYRQRFEGIYGRAAVSTRALFDATPVSRVETFSPVLLATLVIGVGWVLTLEPELMLDIGVLGAVELSGAPVVPVAPLQYAFAGAYTFVVLDLVRRSFVVDLRNTAYLSAVSRIVTVVLIVAVLHVGKTDFTSTDLAIAFSLGFFPRAALEALQAKTVRPLGRWLQGRREGRKLGELDGMDIWQETRLLELGIENIQQLATSDLVEILLRSRTPSDRLVDWLDRALLLLLLPSEAKRRQEMVRELHSVGIRYATDLVDVYESGSHPYHAAVARALGMKPAALATAVASLRRQRNYWHVFAFRSTHPFVPAPSSPSPIGRDKMQPTGLAAAA